MKEKVDYIFGLRTTLEAIEAGKEIERVLIRKGLRGELYGELIKKIRELQVPHQFVPEERINRVTRKNHQGILTYLSAVEYQDIEQIVPMVFEAGKIPFFLILDGVTDVRNFGAIARTAECAGVDAIVVPTKNTAQINADAVKTSAGALHKIPVCRVESLVNIIEYFQQSGVKVVAATEKSDINYYQLDMTSPLAIVMGSEDKGISEGVLRKTDDLVRIPILGTISSLNVSVAASVLMYEAVRQRI